jgi:hypothetical protein
MAQTAVEWLINQVEDFFCLIPVDIIEKAEKMEKEQIMHSYMHGQDNEFSHLMVGKLHITAEEYFQDTYKTKECKK